VDLQRMGVLRTEVPDRAAEKRPMWHAHICMGHRPQVPEWASGWACPGIPSLN